MISREKLALLIVTAALSGIASSAGAAPPVRVSCTQNNVLVHREDVSRESIDLKRADIADRYPAALCIFLDVASDSVVTVGDPTAGAANSGGNGPDTDLVTALAAISNKNVPERVGEAIPASFSQRFGDFQTKKENKQKIGLAIGIYDDVPLTDVLSHWRAAAAQTSWLSRMTPTVSTAGKVTLLSLDGVQDEDVGNVCSEAEERGMKCLAAY
jgi:hypothetical protein